MKKLNKKDMRTIKLGAAGVVIVLVFMFTMDFFSHWAEVRKSLAAARAQLKIIQPTKASVAGLALKVPVFEMPEREEKQKFLFRTKLAEQLKKAGVKAEPIQVLAPTRTKQQGYQLLRLKCRGKCNFAQVLDLLVSLNENPYLVGVEEFKIKVGKKKRNEMELDLTVSTMIKGKR